MSDLVQYPYYWAYNGTKIEDLSHNELLEACCDAFEEIDRLREENARLTKLAIWAPPHVSGSA